MAKTTKPTKQQVAQAKARAGGNNPVKVTNAGLKKLGSAALIAASLTPAGRAVKGASVAAKAIKAEAIMAKAGSNAAAKAGSRADAKRGVYAKENMPKKFIKKTESTKAEAKANARGLKAANKPTNKTGTKADRSDRRALQGNSNLIKNASPARPNRTRGGSLGAIKTYGGQGLATAKLTPKEAARQAEITKELNPIQRAAKNKALANSAKGKTQTPTAEAARRRNLNK